MLSAKRSLEWSRVEHFIKHDLAWHVPSCNAIQVGADAATCAEHCVRCAFGGTDDPSRCQPCECEHALRCPNCAEVHSLREDFDLLLRSVDTALDRAETVARDSEEGDAAPSLQRVRDVRESVREVALLVSRALIKFAAFYAHERQAAHEREVKQMLLDQLDDKGCVMVADWKVHTAPQTHMACTQAWIGLKFEVVMWLLLIVIADEVLINVISRGDVRLLW